MEERREISGLVAALLENARSIPDKTAITDLGGARETNYHTLVFNAKCVTGYLQEKGIPEGSFIIVNMPRGMEYMAAELGIWLAGCAVVPAGLAFPDERIRYIAKHCESPLVLDLSMMEEILSDGQPADGRIPLQDDNMLLIYTSGSTGRPKGVLHTGKTFDDLFPYDVKAYGWSRETVFGTAAAFYFIACHLLYEVLRAGGTVHIYNDQIQKDVVLMERYNEMHGVTMAYISPAMLRMYHGGGLVTAITGGEKLVLRNFNEDFNVWNTYGMTELGPICLYPVPHGLQGDIPVGRPLEPLEYKVIREDGAEAAPGEKGELLLRGRQFCKEYYKDPEKTAELFRGGWLHTGDLVHEGADGLLYYDSRRDWMVKIRGHRVEIPEVESALGDIPGVFEAAVKAFTDEDGETSLTAYYSGEEMSPESLRDQLREKLPHYMVPNLYVHLERLPRNINNKLDRNALSAPETVTFQEEYIAPVSPGQERICRSMEKVLGVPRVGLDDDFFEMGGDSMSCITLIAQMQQDYGVHLSVRAVYEGRTPEKIDNLMKDVKEEHLEEEEAEALGRPQKLLPYQVYYLDYQLYSQGKRIANTPQIIRVPGADPEALAAACDKVFRHFSIYGTVFDLNEDGVISQRWAPELIRPVKVVRTTREELDELIIREMNKSTRMLSHLLYSCRVFVVDGECVLVLSIHHAISDGRSKMSTIRFIFDALAGKELPPDHYYLYLERVAARTSGPRGAEIIRRMEETYGSITSRFPKPDRDGRENIEGAMDFTLPRPYGEYLAGAQQRNASMAVAFTAAGLLALSRYNGEERSAVEWIFNGRDEEWKEDLVGITICAVPAAVDLSRTGSAQQLLDAVRQETAFGIRYADFSFASRIPGPGVNEYMKMVFQQGIELPDNLPEGSQIHTEYKYLEGTISIFQCLLVPVPEESSPRIHINYNAARYEEESIRRFGAMLSDAFEEILFS